MSHTPYAQNVVTQALVGTDKPTLNIGLLPEALRPTAQALSGQSQDKEDNLFKIASLVLSDEETLQKLGINSFSIEQMAHYQHLQTAISKQELSEQEATDPLLSQVQMHVGPMPLPVFQKSDKPVFPNELSSLIHLALASDFTGVLLYWLLKKLSAYNMQFESTQVTMDLLTWFDKPVFQEIRLSYGRPLLSNFMLKELILKVGGDSLRYLLPLVTQNKLAHTLVDDINRVKGVANLPVSTTEPDANGAAAAGATEDASNSPASGLDYAKIFNGADGKDALGVFIYLRQTNPQLARELFAKRAKRFGSDTVWLFVSHFMINLSLDDEPLLTSILKDTNHRHVRETVQKVLEHLPHSQYAVRCAEQCSKYLRFNEQNQCWQLDIIEFSPEIRELGLEPEYKNISTNTELTKRILIDLLRGMDWSDFKALAKSNDDGIALRRWQLFEKSIKNGKDYSIDSILANVILKSGDVKAMDVVLHDNYMLGHWAPCGAHEAMMMFFPPQERKAWLGKHTGNYISNRWFIENGTDPLEFQPLDESWLLEFFRNFADGIDYIRDATMAVMFGMYGGYGLIDECRDKIEDYQREMQGVEDHMASVQADYENAVHKDSKKLQYLYQQRVKRDQFKNKITFVENVLAILLARQRIEDSLKQCLG